MSNENMSLVEVMSQVEERFLEVAPPGILFASEQGYAIQIFDNNSYLKKVAQDDGYRSLLQAMCNVASIGLSLNPAKKQAYLIPRSVHIGGGKHQTKVFLEPSYMGLVDIATGTGIIEWVQAETVYSNDTFELQGLDKAPIHKYNPFLTKEQRGEFIGAYCSAKLKTGDYLTTAMSAEDIHGIRDRSEIWKKSIEKGGNGAGPWLTDFGEQAKKTVVRRAFKMWPKTDAFDRMKEAVHISNENEGFDPIATTSPEITQFTADQKQYFDEMITKNDSIRMFIFMASIEHGVQTSLFNSFEKGSIGKYKDLVRKMLDSGRGQVADIIAELENATASNDDLAAKELLEGLSQEATDYILNNVGGDVRAFLTTCINELTEKAA